MRTLPSRSSMVAETRALRSLASKRWILNTMNCSTIIESTRVRETRGKIQYLIGTGGRTVIDAEIRRHSDLLREVQHSLIDNI